MALSWHISDLENFYKDAGELTNMTPYLESVYITIKVKQVNNHTYMVVGMDFSEKCVVKLLIT